MKRKLVVIPIIKIHPTKIITYNELHWYPSPPPRKSKTEPKTHLVSEVIDGKMQFVRKNLNFINSSKTSGGKLSKQAKKKLNLSIEYFLALNQPQNGKSGYSGSSFKNSIGFITLTLPSTQVHTDNFIKSQCLNQLFIELRNYNHVTNYVWRAEYQKNGNIHFHVLINTYVYWKELQRRWNRIISKLGYVQKYRENMMEFHRDGFKVRQDLISKWSVEKQYKAYLEGVKNDWSCPNSTDIHKIKNVISLQNYITKYMGKTEDFIRPELILNKSEENKIGRIWGASIIFSNITGATAEISGTIEEHLKNIEEHFKSKVFRGEHFTVINITIEEIERLKYDSLFSLFYSYFLKEFGYHHQFCT